MDSQAVATLLLKGFNDDAFAAIRSMLEIEFQLSAIWKKPDITEQFVRENEIFRARRLQGTVNKRFVSFREQRRRILGRDFAPRVVDSCFATISRLWTYKVAVARS